MMSDPDYNEQTIKRYLLGVLSEVETERLDELSIANDGFADALSAAEKELVDSYVQGELRDDDLARFKSHYLASAVRRKRVDFAKALQYFGERATGASAAAIDEAPRTSAAGKKGWFSGLLTSPPVLQWGFATLAIVLVIAGGLLLLQNIRLRQQINQTQARRDELQQRELELQKQLENQRTANASTEQELARVREEHAQIEQQLKSGKPQPSVEVMASLILTPQMRGAGQIKTVSLSRDTQRVAIQLQLEPNSYSTYIVILVDQTGGQTLWRSGKTKAPQVSDHRSLNISFRAGLLRAGTYRLQVSGISIDGTSEVVSEYPFRVVKQ
jgi:hypothetical protein